MFPSCFPRSPSLAGISLRRPRVYARRLAGGGPSVTGLAKPNNDFVVEITLRGTGGSKGLTDVRCWLAVHFPL